MSTTPPSTSSSSSAVAEPGVQAFFERGSARWDSIYEGEKRSVKEWLIDTFFHATIQRRYEISMEELAPFEGRHYFDCGCGSGRYSTELAVRGAAHVTGLDFAEGMLDIAREAAKSRGVADKCTFLQADFTKWDPSTLEQPFDAAVCIGFFEYQRDVQSALNKLAKATKGTIVISFPKKHECRMYIRVVRYAYNKCYLRLFVKKDVEDLVKNCSEPIKSYKIRETDREYLLIVQTV